MSDIVIGEGTSVTLHFSLSLQSGEIIDSNFDKRPATFKVGDGNLLPGFERVLFGLSAGAKQTFDIPPEMGFGQQNPNNIQSVEIDNFRDIELAKGLVVTFKDASGTEVPGVVISFSETDVEIDFNHPLSGRTIIFKVDIISVEPTVTH